MHASKEVVYSEVGHQYGLPFKAIFCCKDIIYYENAAKITKYFNYCYALPYYLPIFHGLTNVMSENLDISIILHTFALLF